jgi:hypothetical protein
VGCEILFSENGKIAVNDGSFAENFTFIFCAVAFTGSGYKDVSGRKMKFFAVDKVYTASCFKAEEFHIGMQMFVIHSEGGNTHRSFDEYSRIISVGCHVCFTLSENYYACMEKSSTRSLFPIISQVLGFVKIYAVC